MARAATIRLPGLLSTRPDALVASALLNVAALAVPVLMLQVYDRIIPNAAYATLAALIAGVCAAIALEAALRHARATISMWSAAQEEHSLTGAALSRLLGAHPRAAVPAGMQADGMDNVLQLDGGILGYFERVGGFGYDGHCFVFDARVALDPQLRPLHDGAPA